MLITSLTASQSLQVSAARPVAALVRGAARCRPDAARGLEQPGRRVLDDRDLGRARHRGGDRHRAQPLAAGPSASTCCSCRRCCCRRWPSALRRWSSSIKLGLSPNIPFLVLGHVVVCVPFVLRTTLAALDAARSGAARCLGTASAPAAG